ncbi:putative inorganic carbon transporter subunit DabA, partial [Congregibacter sp.]
GLHQHFDALPATAEALLVEATAELLVPEEAMGDYFHALLLDINGWSSWVAYLRWQSKLAGGSDNAMHQLLAIRLAWELVLWRHQETKQQDTITALSQEWTQQFSQLSDLLQQHRQYQEPAWVWQQAAEVAFQQATQESLLTPAPVIPAVTQRPALQAVFCIDVRSEVYRRALESQDPSIQTFGFAGFFGLPIEYAPAGASYTRPQLPGLLAPALSVSESNDNKGVSHRTSKLNRQARWSAISKVAPAAFGYVESLGLGYAFKLLRESLFGLDNGHPVNTVDGVDSHYIISNCNTVLDTSAQAELVAGILGAMTLTDNFATVVILAGHGSSTRNNPHAAGLDCGACGGQTGEINARVLTQLLNKSEVRSALADEHDIEIPQDTRFVAALHNTTTDELRYLTSLPTGTEMIQNWITAAGKAARRERAGKLGVADKNSDKGIMERSRDWSQVRPEWGLAGNACFVVAPRSRTAHLNFAGRSFLHDYNEATDGAKGYPVLELIMTAPMLVTHWINMQYNTSVMDNDLYGSGNKVLHNVVGGNIGVFEGNGGDLRIGLPMQSLHDGQQWMHDSLRLSVYIAAPGKAITDIVDRHEVVRQLVDNDWLYLHRIDDTRNEIQRLYKGSWSIVI